MQADVCTQEGSSISPSVTCMTTRAPLCVSLLLLLEWLWLKISATNLTDENVYQKVLIKFMDKVCEVWHFNIVYYMTYIMTYIIWPLYDLLNFFRIWFRNAYNTNRHILDRARRTATLTSDLQKANTTPSGVGAG